MAGYGVQDEEDKVPPRRLRRGLRAAGLSMLVILAACTQEAPSSPADDGAASPRAGPGTTPDVNPKRLPQNGVSPGPGGSRDEPVAQDAAMEEAILHPDGSVTASGYLVCTPGETMNVGWAVKNERGNRQAGMVRTGQDRLYFECTGDRQDWTLRGFQIVGGGIDPGLHPYTVKTAVGTGSRHDHRDYFQGTIRVGRA